MMRRHMAWCIAIVSMGCLLVLRIAAVNAGVAQIPIEEYARGETVALEGDFAEYAYEHTDGYEVVVERAERMSVNDYLDRFAAPGEVYDADSLDTTDRDALTLVVLTITIRNGKDVADERGYLDSIGWSIAVPQHPSWWMRVDSDLFNLSVPQIEGAYQLAVRPGTEFQIHVPFCVNESAVFPQAAGTYARAPLPAGRYTFVVTKMHTRKQVAFEVG